MLADKSGLREKQNGFTGDGTPVKPRTEEERDLIKKSLFKSIARATQKETKEEKVERIRNEIKNKHHG